MTTHADVVFKDGAQHHVLVSRAATFHLGASKGRLIQFLVCRGDKVFLEVGTLFRISRLPHIELTDDVISRQAARLHLGEVIHHHLLLIRMIFCSH